MRNKAIWILVLSLVLCLTGCTPPHANAQGSSGSDVIILESGHDAGSGQVVVTLKPIPTPTATPQPTQTQPVVVVETPVPSPSPTPTPTQAPQEIAEPDRSEGQKYVYLTFDDGPSKNTESILEILEEKGVHATFFVIGDNALKYPDQIRAIAEQGSVVANHTQTHETDEIYKSADAFLADLEACEETIHSILGEDYYPSDLIRFPYGSTNRRCRDYRDEIKAAGYRYFDWNALNGDAESGASGRSAEDLYDEFVETVDVQANRGRDIIVLMHDTNSKVNTVKMLPDAIDYLKELGYTFATLENVPMS